MKREFLALHLGNWGKEIDMDLIIIVEDKEEEIRNAQMAVKSHFGIPSEEEGAYFGIDFLKEKLGNPDWRVFKSGDALVSIMTARNLSEVKRGLDKIYIQGFCKVFQQVGVITDLMFPKKKGGKEDPNGLCVLTDCIQKGLPVVVCSDTDHHDVGYLKDVFPVLGKAHPKGEIPVILDKKDWGRAVSELFRISVEESPDDRKNSPSGIEID
ncbi:MAG: hypothetical protein WAW13_03395 [Minisyncoccia bacterium]